MVGQAAAAELTLQLASSSTGVQSPVQTFPAMEAYGNSRIASWGGKFTAESPRARESILAYGLSALARSTLAGYLG